MAHFIGVHERTCMSQSLRLKKHCIHMDVKDVTPMGDEGSLAYTTHILTAVPGTTNTPVTTALNSGKANLVSARGMMAKAPKGAGGGKKGDKDGGGGADAKDNKGEHGLGVTPINYFKDGKDPSVKPDEEYPEWLWNLQLPSLARLKRTKEEDYTVDEFRRFVQLDSRQKIKSQNRSGRF